MSIEPSSGASREPSSGLRVVLDTNVYISIFNYPDRPLFRVWEYALLNRYCLFVSPAIIRELASVLRRETFAWDELRIRDTLKAISHIGNLIVPDFTLDVITEDPPDNRILECAVAGNANLIVSGNRHLIRLRAYEGIGIVRPRDCMRMLGIAED